MEGKERSAEGRWRGRRGGARGVGRELKKGRVEIEEKEIRRDGEGT